MKVIKQVTYKQPSGIEITMRKVRMVWTACTNLCVERIIAGRVQEGWYGWEETTLLNIWNDWGKFEERIGSILL